MNRQMVEDQEEMAEILFQARINKQWKQYKFADVSLDELINKFRAFAISLGYSETEVNQRIPYE